MTKAHHRSWAATLVVAVALMAGCLEGRAYPCATDIECRVDGVQGLCHATGFCVYPDGRCPSELRYGPAAGDGLAFECVPPGGSEGNESNAFVGAESSSSSVSPSSSSSIAESGSQGASSDGCGACEMPPSDCFEPVGTCGDDGCTYTPVPAGDMCVLDDPCVAAAACDGAGTCVAVEGMPCNNPPGPCDSSRGVCQKDGSCTYDPQPPGTECDDGDGCTSGETCDAAGVCGGGQGCESDNPCETASCVGGNCQLDPVADGTSCGASEAARCCDGDCVDISSDEANCGGCGVSCDSDDTCETVSATNTCDLAPAATTGRCTCDAANIDCPLGQVCRTVSPFANRCTPNGAGNCVNSFQDVNACPNYCFYP